MAQPAARKPRGNLPAELTSFVGRRRELAAIRSTLSDARLLTLTGAGGVGKTRLALRAGRELSRTLPDGVWLVELQELRNASLVPTVIMTALGVRDQSGRSAVSLLVDYLEDKELLLILDNCEHLLDTCSVVVGAILRGTPGIRVLATSRQPLNRDGEFVYPVPPLAVPEVTSATSIDQLRQFEAISLFCDRAAAASGQFELSAENHVTVVELCRQLDGMPLALELAAVRTRALGVEEIVTRLKDRFDLLVGGSRSAVPRQQTLRAAIDWSYDLLPPDEQALFRKLAVFAGDFDLEVVEAICSSTQPAHEAPVDLLSSLVEKSLVNRVGTNVRARFRLNETMQKYALERLYAAGEVDATRSKHLSWYSRLGVSADADSFSSRLLPLFDRLDAEASNIRVAFQYCIENEAQLDMGLDFAASLHFWWAARSFTEAIGTLQSLLGAGKAGDRPRARTLFVLGNIYMSANHQLPAWSVLEEALLGLVVVLSLVGTGYESVAKAADVRAYPPPGRMIDVGGYSLHINCVGTGTPTVVIEAGWGDSSVSWSSWVQPEVARTTRVCTYDRAGMGYSEPGPLPRTAERFAQELHTLLSGAGVAGPYVLVGHSSGGLPVRVFAHRYVAEVAGVVLIESMSPSGAKPSASATPAQSDSHSIADLAITVPARTGVLRLLAGPLQLNAGLAPEVANAYTAVSVTARYLQTWLDEGKGMPESLAQAGVVKSLGALPLIVLSSGLKVSEDQDWQRMQTELLELSSSSQQLFADNSGHNIQIDQPEAAVGAIERMVEQTRQQASLAAR